MEFLPKKLETVFNTSERCVICGEQIQSPLSIAPVICEELKEDWKLDEEQRAKFNYREGATCLKCGSSVRIRNLGAVFLEIFNLNNKKKVQTFVEFLGEEDLEELFIAEINNCGPIHEYIKKAPNLYYSEYKSGIPGIASEDLMNLTYAENFFDRVIMSDVLEHVPDYKVALKEIKRVLKPSGSFIFTIPILFDRETVTRAKVSEEGGVQYIKTPSYHGEYKEKRKDFLVFHEFGKNFIADISRFFDTSVYVCDIEGGSFTSVFVCKKN